MKLVCVLHQFVNVLIFGRCVAFHSFFYNLNIATAAAQDVTQRSFQIVNTNRIAGWDSI